MRVTLQPIMGVQLGFELYDSERLFTCSCFSFLVRSRFVS